LLQPDGAAQRDRDGAQRGEGVSVQASLDDQPLGGLIKSREGDQGVAACPYGFYGQWISDPEGPRKRIEAVTRSTVGTEEAPIVGIPNAATLAQHGPEAAMDATGGHHAAEPHYQLQPAGCSRSHPAVWTAQRGRALGSLPEVGAMVAGGLAQALSD
jgi:hypothetical protein